jgi:hypothetical protein
MEAFVMLNEPEMRDCIVALHVQHSLWNEKASFDKPLSRQELEVHRAECKRLGN